MNFRSSTHYQRRDTKDGQLLSTPWALHSFSCVRGPTTSYKDERRWSRKKKHVVSMSASKGKANEKMRTPQRGRR